MRLLIPLLLVLWILLGVVALAEEPCVYTDQRTRVSCTLDGFKKLTSAVVTAESEAKECRIRLTASEQSHRDAADALKACVSFVPKAPEPKSKLSQRAGFLLTALGASSVTVGVVSTEATANRFAFSLAGALSMAAGYWLLGE
jgi:hypothetical protein